MDILSLQSINREEVVDDAGVIIIGSRIREEFNDLSDNKYCSSGVLVLCVVVLQTPHRKKVGSGENNTILRFITPTITLSLVQLNISNLWDMFIHMATKVITE